MNKKLVTSTHESDGKFALRLESAAACQRDMMREQERRQRAEQVRRENAEFTALTGIDASEVFA